MVDKTRYITIEGPCKWARLYEGNMDTKFGEKFNVDIYPTEKSWNLLKEVGFKGKTREDEDGKFIKIHRENKKQYSDRLETLGPPKVTDAQGNHFEETIGNGSTLSVLLEVYPSKFGTGSRISEVRVLKHVPYVKEAETAGPPVD